MNSIDDAMSKEGVFLERSIRFEGIDHNFYLTAGFGVDVPASVAWFEVINLNRLVTIFFV